jgi:hypothetical protein
MKSIDRCPREIWDAILTLACTDGGKTGCALSQVSKHIREISHCIRIQSACLESLRQVDSFQRELERRKPSERRVRFLYLSDFSLNSRASSESVPASPTEEAALYHQLIREPDATFATFSTLVVSTVEVLSISGVRSPIFHQPEHLSFPRLQYLYISGELLFSMHTTATLASGGPSLPILRGLHIHGLPSLPDNKHALLATLSRCVPNVTRLRISGVTHEISLSSYMGAFIDASSHAQRVQETALASSLPLRESSLLFGQSNMGLEHLSVLIFEPVKLRRDGWCGTSEAINTVMVFSMMMLSQDLAHRIVQARSSEVRLVVLPEAAHDRKKIRRDWEDVAAGGLGAWGS